MTQIITLPEFEPVVLPAEMIPLTVGEKLWREYDQWGGKIRVEFPGLPTNGRWRLTAQGWVGHIPLTPELHLVLQPKVPLGNLFRMWEYAYGLKSVSWLTGLTQVESLAEFYERLACCLAEQVLQRGRQGFHHTYLTETAVLPYVRGRLQNTPSHKRPAQLGLHCQYQEHRADIPDNQILAYTLWQIGHHHRCGPNTQQMVRQAYQAVSSIATPHPITAMACIGRFYTRLNQDYQPLHALCRFFLEHSGPNHTRGDHTMLPFLFNTARLYELFVAEWLKTHLPSPWQVKAQEHVHLGAHDELEFAIDLVIYNRGDTSIVLDTKYKTADHVAPADFHQLVTYAKAKDGKTAVLVYPTPLPKPLNLHFADLHIRTLTFALDQDLETAGQTFLSHLLHS